jgi:general L-amino acid transport system permease protein
MKPPPAGASPRGALTWLRTRLFATPLDTVVTLACLAFLAWTVPRILGWAVFHATWTGPSREACQGAGGACWAFVTARFGQFVYGFYPVVERWRVDLAGLWLALLVLVAAGPSWRGKRAAVLALGVPFPVGAAVLLLGGVGGLPLVETREWGGLMLTIVLAVSAGAIALPFGILLALGRQSGLPLVRSVAIAFIEFWRGVPILAVIFLASILLPLILPNGVTVDKLVRAIVGLALVVGAYMAEAVRGGLQSLPPGQAEAAKALGLGYWLTTRHIILPQALRIALPALVNEFIALLKNTTLVLIVSLLDLLGIGQAALADPKWVGLTAEAYSFAGAVFWILCFGMSRYSLRMERRFAKARAR